MHTAGYDHLISGRCLWDQQYKQATDILLRAVDTCLLSITAVFLRECSGMPINRCYTRNSVREEASLGKSGVHKLYQVLWCNTSPRFSYVDLLWIYKMEKKYSMISQLSWSCLPPHPHFFFPLKGWWAIGYTRRNYSTAIRSMTTHIQTGCLEYANRNVCPCGSCLKIAVRVKVVRIAFGLKPFKILRLNLILKILLNFLCFSFSLH